MSYGFDDLDDEEAELDRIAARDRDDDPRADLGYQPAPAVHPTLEPRTVKPPPGAGHWGIAWIPGEAREAGAIGGGPHVCARCGESCPVLHAIGDDPRRKVCGACSGKANRERVGWASAKVDDDPASGKRGGR